jgi:phosphatidylglycerol:prolipoprotein diacylglycerol transferase
MLPARLLHRAANGLTVGHLGIDGKLGLRCAPTQQFESLACLVIGPAVLLLVLQSRRPAAGTVFIGALAAYTLCRQILFP